MHNFPPPLTGRSYRNRIALGSVPPMRLARTVTWRRVVFGPGCNHGALRVPLPPPGYGAVQVIHLVKPKRTYRDSHLLKLSEQSLYKGGAVVHLASRKSPVFSRNARVKRYGNPSGLRPGHCLCPCGSNSFDAFSPSLCNRQLSSTNWQEQSSTNIMWHQLVGLIG